MLHRLGCSPSCRPEAGPMRRALARVLGLAMCGLASCPAQAAEDERLAIIFPQDWRLGYQGRAGETMISEWVPAGQTVEAWADMINVMILRGRSDLDPRTDEHTSEL